MNVFQLCGFPVEEPYVSQWMYWASICEEADNKATYIHQKANQPPSGSEGSE
jgi:hypothetical protein